jgi:hypothetical protein
MKVVKLTVDGTDKEETASLHIESKRGDTWVVDRVIDVTTGQPNASQQVELRDDQRLVIVPVVRKMTYDREQAAVVADDGKGEKLPETKPEPSAAKGQVPSSHTQPQPPEPKSHPDNPMRSTADDGRASTPQPASPQAPRASTPSQPVKPSTGSSNR